MYTLSDAMYMYNVHVHCIRHVYGMCIIFKQLSLLCILILPVLLLIDKKTPKDMCMYTGSMLLYVRYLLCYSIISIASGSLSFLLFSSL